MATTIRRITEEETNTLMRELDAESELGNGAVLLSLFEVQQGLMFMPGNTTSEKHFGETVLTSFSALVIYIYNLDDGGEAYLSDLELLQNKFKKIGMQ